MALKASLVVLSVLALTFFDESSGLSCVRCDDKPCEIPACCESGQYVHDVCGCCPVCARPIGKRCGGPWGVSGTCSKDLSCLRSCECSTLPKTSDEERHQCIFPFSYKGVTYNGCTLDHSTNGLRWCAYEVDENGIVIDGKWGDCSEACINDGEDPETFICEESFLFNLDGVCVEKDKEQEFNETQPSFAFRFEPGATIVEPAPVCSSPEEATRCHCVENPSGEPVGQKSGCNKDAGQTPDGGSTSYGWCFLENIDDPTDPTKNCFPDTIWSATHGRYWSHRACVPDDITEERPIGAVIEAGEFDDTTVPPPPEDVE